jgi:hypothetical protein
VYAQGPRARRPLPTSPFAAPASEPAEEFVVGDRVIHDAHGLGRVIDIEESGAIHVDFGTMRERLVKPYPKLSKL